MISWPISPGRVTGRGGMTTAIFFLKRCSPARKPYISYCGQSSEDNSVILPSVLISELLDYLEQGFSEGEKIRDRVLTVHHPRHHPPILTAIRNYSAIPGGELPGGPR